MIFYSSFIHKNIVDGQKKAVGKIVDILARAAGDKEFPVIVGFVVKRPQGKQNSFVGSEHVADWKSKGRQIVLSGPAKAALEDVPENHKTVSLRTQVIDRQIVDLRGMRVVRVNDLQLGVIKNTLRIMAIDIGTGGLLRRLGIGSFGRSGLVPQNMLEWKNVRLIGNKLQLETEADELIKLHPADIANIIEKINLAQGKTFLQSLSAPMAARVLEEVRPDIKKILIQKLGANNLAGLIAKMSADELADLIQLMPGEEFEKIVQQLPEDAKLQKVKKILQYDGDTAGGLMTTEYITAYPDSIVSEITEKIRLVSPQYHSIHFVYITDREDKLRGIVSTRTLIVSNPGQTMEQIMRKRAKFTTVNVNQDLKTVATLMTKYNLMSVAVVDKDDKLLGIVTVDDIMRRLLPNA